MSDKRVKNVASLSETDKENLEQEGYVLLNRFHEAMTAGTAVEDLTGLVLEHYLWAKKFICTNKTSYVRYVNSFVSNKKMRDYLAGNGGKELPFFIHKTVMKNIGNIKQ